MSFWLRIVLPVSTSESLSVSVERAASDIDRAPLESESSWIKIFTRSRTTSGLVSGKTCAYPGVEEFPGGVAADELGVVEFPEVMAAIGLGVEEFPEFAAELGVGEFPEDGADAELGVREFPEVESSR